MHGTEQCEQKPGRLALPLPDNRIIGYRIDASKHAAVFFCPGPGARNGFSLPQQRSLPSKLPFPGSMFPACYFAPWLAASTTRSALLLDRSDRLAPIRTASLLLARCSFRDSLANRAFRPPLPLGIFRSRWIKAFNRISDLPARLPKSPDLPSLPAAGFYY